MAIAVGKYHENAKKKNCLNRETEATTVQLALCGGYILCF